jgi:hypothetical protein
MKRLFVLGILAILLVPIIWTPAIHAEWIENGSFIFPTSTEQTEQQMIPDGAGGAIIVWRHGQASSAVGDILAMRIDAYGRSIWAGDTVAVCIAIEEQNSPHLASDGDGGAIITWIDKRNDTGDIYAQRIDADGNVMWMADGVEVCIEQYEQVSPKICSDEEGGAIVSWKDYRDGNWDIYAQRIDALGITQWQLDGAPVCTTAAPQDNHEILMTYLRLVITWQDERNGDWDIYADEINKSNGGSEWVANGRVVCGAAGDQTFPKLATDGGAGAIITWQDNRSGSGDVYAQRVRTGDGAPVWLADGNAICTAFNDQVVPEIISDDAFGAIITWSDDRSGNWDVYVQRVDYEGNILMMGDGIPVATERGHKLFPRLIPDGLNGAIIVWDETDTVHGGYNIYTQRIDPFGNPYWALDGEIICDHTGYAAGPQIASDGKSGAIITWLDGRPVNEQFNLYAQRIERNAYWGYPSPYIYDVRDVPGDQGGSVDLSWYSSWLDPWPSMGTISYYTVWRAITKSSAMALVDQGGKMVSSPPEVAIDAPGPVVRSGQAAGDTYFWRLMATVPAYHLEAYSEIISTTSDSTGVSSDYHYFQVIAHSSTPTIFWESPPDSGYSIDNLAPAAPLYLAGQQSASPEGLSLSWRPNSEADLDGYRVYRGLNAGFIPGPGNLLGSPEDTTSFDDGWRWNSGYYYKVSALDVHGNESGYALLAPEDISGGDGTPVPLITYLGQNYPNPFQRSTRIVFGLEDADDISLRIYTVSGQLVRTLAKGNHLQRTYSLEWDGKDARGNFVSSGIYFYQLTTRQQTFTKKMILLK